MRNSSIGLVDDRSILNGGDYGDARDHKHRGIDRAAESPCPSPKMAEWRCSAAVEDQGHPRSVRTDAVFATTSLQRSHPMKAIFAGMSAIVAAAGLLFSPLAT